MKEKEKEWHTEERPSDRGKFVERMLVVRGEGGEHSKSVAR